ncbi:MAG: hypothetical protein H0U22_11760 [Geodermatophilaceae bacterium]|nr:hypothetical protein [Geodermatophilaceae bacterium]
MPNPPQPGTLRTSPDGSRLRSGGALTAWANSWLRGAVSYDAALAAIHEAGIGTVRGLSNQPEPAPVGWALSTLRSAGGRPLRLVLPVPGDIRGVPDSPGLAAAATHAGQLVVAPGVAFLPDPNPDPDPSADRVWLSWELADAMPANATPGEQQTVSQAEGALRHAVLDATDVLAALDVARWNPGVESLLCREPLLALPHDHEPSAVALATRATRLGAILELAWTAAPGGALNAHGAVSRDAALRPLSVAVREALMTAYSATPVRRTIAR